MSIGLFERGQLALQSQRFSSILGARLTTLYPGKACLELPVDENHEQQHGFVHGGVISYVADNTLTFAAGSILGDCVTSEFKLNYVRPAVGSSLLIAEAEVIAPALIIGLRGRSVTGSRLISLNGSPDGSTSTLPATTSSPRSASASA